MTSAPGTVVPGAVVPGAVAPVASASGTSVLGTSSPAALFIGSEIYRGSSYGSAHPLRIPRVSTVMDLARALHWLPPNVFRQSPQAKPAALTLWHDPAYIAALQRAEAEGGVSDATRLRYGLGTLSNPVFPQMFRRPATGAGGVMLAAGLLSGAPTGTIHVPGGGTHHGLADRANGFCYLNDVVLGIKVLQRAGMTRIAYVDLDAHHCDGVEAAFTGDPTVLMISVHEEARWPGTGRLEDDAGGRALNLPVPAGFNDSESRVILHELILPALDGFRPEVLVLQCGADSLAEDPLSRLTMSNRAYLEAVAALRGRAPRLLVLGGGGYNPWSVGRLWTAIWGLLSGQDLPEELPAPVSAILGALSWNGGKRPPPAEAMLRTLVDAPREGPVRPEIRERLAALRTRALAGAVASA